MQNLNTGFVKKLPLEFFSGVGKGNGTGAFSNKSPNVLGTACVNPFSFAGESQATQSGRKTGTGAFHNKYSSMFQLKSDGLNTAFIPKEQTGQPEKHASLEKIYLAAGVPLNENTLPDNFLKDATFIKEEKLGKGFNNEVKKLTFKMNHQETRAFAFKPCKPGFGVSAGTIASGLIGYDVNDKGEPIFENDETPVYLTNASSRPFGDGCRNIATGVLAKMLGCENVVTKTRFFIHEDKLGILMDLESGHTVNKGTVWGKDISGTRIGKGLLDHRKTLSSEDDQAERLRKATCLTLGLQEINFFEEMEGDKPVWRVSANFTKSLNITTKELASQGPVKEQASEAEIIDILSRQADRHSGNYVVDMIKGSLKLIDNDISFGPRSWTDMRDEMKQAEVGCIVPDFPAFISSKMFKALKDLTDEAFKSRLSGLISTEEIRQTIATWQEVKALYEKNPERVLKPDADWTDIPLGGYLKRDTAKISKNEISNS